MPAFELAFFFGCALLGLLGAVATVAARNPIRSAMGLLTSIMGIAGLYLALTAEFLAVTQVIVYAGAVVVLFLFVIMLLGPSATSPRDARTAIPRYLGATALLSAVALASAALFSQIKSFALLTQVGSAASKVPSSFGTIEGVGHELFTTAVVPFELSGALLVVAVVGAIAVARGKQPDPTTQVRPSALAGAGPESPRAVTPAASPRANEEHLLGAKS